MTRFALTAAVLFAATALLPAPRATGGEAEDFRKVLDAWAARRDGRTLRATFDGTVLHPAGSLNVMKGAMGNASDHPEDWPAEDHVHPDEWSVLLDPQNERGNIKYRSETFFIGADPPFFQKNSQRTLFDGERWQAYRPRTENEYAGPDARNPDLAFGEDASLNTVFGYDPYPVFLQAGYFTASPEAGRLPLGDLPTERDHAPHGYVENGGRRLLVVRSAPSGGARRYREYWADPARGGEIASLASVTKHGPDWEIKIEYEERDGRGRVPVRWAGREYEGGRISPDALIRETNFRLGEYERGVPVADGDFRLEPEPGWLIEREDSEGGYEPYVQPEPGEPPGDAADFVAPGWGFRDWLFLACGAGCAAGVGLWLFRRFSDDIKTTDARPVR